MPSESDVIRWVGVGVAVVGSVAAMPFGTRLGALGLHRTFRGAWLALHEWLRAIWRRLRRRRTVGSSVQLRWATDSAGVSDSASVFVTWAAWDTAAPISKQIELLHMRTNELLDQIHRLQATASDDVDRLRASIVELTAKVSNLEERVREQERTAAEVDARALPLVGLGIVMTGIPDGLARFPALGWIVVGAALLYAARVLPRAWRAIGAR